MSVQRIFSILLLVFVLGGIIYWYTTRPSPQESVVRIFFQQICSGNADNAAEYLVDESYGRFIKQSVIVDSNDIDLKEGWGEKEAQLDNIARTHIPFAKGHIRGLEFESMFTQQVRSQQDLASVQFVMHFRIKETIDAPSIPGSVNGMIHLRHLNGRWLIENGNFNIHMAGRSIMEYVDYNTL